jgi:hypothetical protein
VKTAHPSQTNINATRPGQGIWTPILGRPQSTINAIAVSSSMVLMIVTISRAFIPISASLIIAGNVSVNLSPSNSTLGFAEGYNKRDR